MRYSIIAVILTAYDVRDTLFRGGCSCIPAARSRGNFASERIACMRDVIHRERITCRTRRFIGGKTKNKHQAGGLWRKKKRIEGNLRSIKVSPGNVASFPSSLSLLSPPIRCGLYDRIFTSVSNVLEEYIIHPGECDVSRCSRYIYMALHRLWIHQSWIRQSFFSSQMCIIIILGFSLS